MSEQLLAVDLGLRTGFAILDGSGRLLSYQSRNFGTRSRLKKAIYSVLSEAPDITVVVIEGGGDLALPWISEIERRGLRVIQINAERWRSALLLSRHQRHGSDAKRNADVLARKIIDWSGAKRPTSLRHDAAEAICIGFWGVLHVRWLPEIAKELSLD